MDPRGRAVRRVSRFAQALTVAFIIARSVCAVAGPPAQGKERPARVRQWPCRLVVKPTLDGVVEDGWRRSPTLQRQCRDLAEAGAVVALEWGRTDSQSRALNDMKLAEDGVVVARVSVPPVSDAIELVAHELEHVIERARGMDYAAEAKRRGSGVWRAYGGFETQRAIDAGRQVAKELRETPRVPR